MKNDLGCFGTRLKAGENLKLRIISREVL